MGNSNYVGTFEIDKELRELDYTIKSNKRLRRTHLLYIQTLEKQLHDLQGAFWWRVTKPMRIICKKLNHYFSIIPGIRHVYLPFKNYISYRRSIKDYAMWHINKREKRKHRRHKFDKCVKFSILVPLYNTSEKFLTDMLDSVIKQTYTNWELCIADGSDLGYEYIGKLCQKLSDEYKGKVLYKKLDRNLGISENTNECIKMATGEYLALLDHDDALHPTALFENMKVICDRNADFIYSDECVFSKYQRDAFDVFFKPDFSSDTLRGYNYICHFTVFSKALTDRVGGFREQFDGSQDYDLFLRLTEVAQSIVHIPKVLYFWRRHMDSSTLSVNVKPYAYTNAINAINEHLERIKLKGSVYHASEKGFYRIAYALEDSPLISIIIPNMDNIEMLKVCIDSIIEKTTYTNYEIIIVENNSKNPKTFEYYESLKRHDKVRLLMYKESFNFSGINNYAVPQARGDYVVLLNNDTEVITGCWLEEMLMFAQRTDVGAVGAMLYYPDNSIQHAGVVLGIGSVAGHIHRTFIRGERGYFGRLLVAQNLSCVTAACMMIPKNVFTEVGGFNEEFAVAFNDVDLCMRIRKAGYLIIWTPYAEMYHHESISRGYDSKPENQERFAKEIKLFQEYWKSELEEGDPYYNVNLTLENTDFSMRE